MFVPGMGNREWGIVQREGIGAACQLYKQLPCQRFHKRKKLIYIRIIN